MYHSDRIKQNIIEGLQRGQTLKDVEAQLQYQTYGNRAVQFQQVAMTRKNGPKETEKRG